jgi:uncharacterized protein (TIGR03382 family)
MNMKRGLVFTLSALALAVCSSAVHAQAPTADVALNLRYTDPADVSEGGTWYLVAKTNSPNGLAGVSAYLSNINSAGATLGSAAGNGYPAVTAANIGAITPFIGTFGSVVNVVYGQDTAAGPIVLNVGRGDGAGPNPAAPGEVATDPFGNAAWNGASVLASGTFGGSRPAFTTSGANSTDANTLASNSTTPPNNFAVDATTSTPKIRGDSVSADGLKNGDANRSGTVNSDDFNLLALNFGGTAGGTRTWDQGDFNDDGNVSGADFALLQNNFGQPATAPQVAAVPEPGTISLAIAAAGLAVAFSRRRS